MSTHVAIPNLEAMINFGRSAGDIVKRVYFSGDLKVQVKADKTLVTKADRQVHNLAFEWLADYPGLVLVGEEGKLGARTHEPQEYWMTVDELDGTNAFARGISTATVMIALMLGDIPVRSVIADPFSNRLYSAERDEGAFLNDMRIRTASSVGPNPMVDVSSWPEHGAYDMLIRDMVSGVAGDLHRMGCEVQAVGGIGIADARVASGEFQATVFPGYTWHDTPAGDLLVTEAGGCTSDLRGKPLRYGKTPPFGHIFSCNKEMHAKIVEITTRHLAAQKAEGYDPLATWK